MADQEIIDHTHFAMLLKGLETALIDSVRNFNDVCVWHIMSFSCVAKRSAITNHQRGVCDSQLSVCGPGASHCTLCCFHAATAFCPLAQFCQSYGNIC